MGHRHKRNRRIPSKGKQLPSYNQVHAAEISETETTFLDTKVYEGDRFNKDSILDVRTHFKPTETFEYTNFYSCHSPSLLADVFWSVTNEPQRTSAGRLVTHQRHKRLHQRRSFKSSRNKFLWNHFWREHEESLRGHFRRQKESTRTEKQKCT